MATPNVFTESQERNQESVLVAVASADNPAFTEERAVPLSVDLTGRLRVDSTGASAGGDVRSTTMISAVTTNTTSSTVQVPTGNKTFYAEVTGTGAVTATVDIYGTPVDSASNGILLATLTLSGTSRDEDATPVSTASWSYYYVVTSNVTGTNAAVTVYAMY